MASQRPSELLGRSQVRPSSSGGRKKGVWRAPCWRWHQGPWKMRETWFGLRCVPLWCPCTSTCRSGCSSSDPYGSPFLQTISWSFQQIRVWAPWADHWHDLSQFLEGHYEKHWVGLAVRGSIKVLLHRLADHRLAAAHISDRSVVDLVSFTIQGFLRGSEKLISPDSRGMKGTCFSFGGRLLLFLPNFHFLQKSITRVLLNPTQNITSTGSFPAKRRDCRGSALVFHPEKKENKPCRVFCNMGAVL